MILVITEKARISKKYAATMRLAFKDGAMRGTYDGKEIVMLNASGHLLTLKYPDEVVDGLTWDSLDMFKTIPRNFQLRVQDPSPNARKGQTPEDMYKRILKQLKRSDIEEVWLATDADDEGELLGWEILDYAQYTGPVQRVWLSRGEDPASIKKALESRFAGSKTRPIAHAAEARRRADWMYMFLVRTYTYFGRHNALGPNLGAGRGREAVVSVGRVQTPTLAMIVKRDREIENFVAHDHFTVNANFIKGQDVIPGKLDIHYSDVFRETSPPGISWLPQGKPDENKPDRPLFVDRNMVDDFIGRLTQASDKATISAYEEGSRLSNPPNTYSLTDAQSDLGKKLKISGGLVQHIISDLYEQGMISYPRTASAELPSSLYTKEEIGAVLKAVSHHSSISEAAQRIKAIHVDNNDPEYDRFTPKVFVDKEMAHHGLIPTHKAVSEEKLNELTPMKQDGRKIPHTSKQMRDVYMLIVERFLQAMLPPAKLATQKGKVLIPVTDMLNNPESHFSIKGERVVDPGYLKYFGNPERDGSFPALQVDEVVPLKETEVKSERTKPPVRYNEASLPKEMENVAKHITDPKYKKIIKHAEGIGTPATRSSIIETLIVRGYVECKKGVYFSTSKGRDLIDIIPEQFSAPETTAIWEEYLSQIKDCNEDEALEKQGIFVEKQASRLEKLIEKIINAYTPKMGERRAPPPRNVTEKMKKIIDAIAKAKGENPPPGVKSNGALASQYINENKTILVEARERANNAPPSEAQLKMLERIIAHLPKGTEVPDDVRSSRMACSRFIDANKSVTPPSQKQVDLAKKLAGELPDDKQPAEDVYLSAQKCSEFISKHIGGKKAVKKK